MSQWTTDTPTTPGPYWYKKHPTNEASLVEVYVGLNREWYGRFMDESGRRYELYVLDGEWFGPLTPPREEAR